MAVTLLPMVRVSEVPSAKANSLTDGCDWWLARNGVGNDQFCRQLLTPPIHPVTGCQHRCPCTSGDCLVETSAAALVCEGCRDAE